MRRSHHPVCGAGLVLALGYLLGTGGSAGGVGLLIAALVCPLAMVLAMSVLMRSDHHRDDTTTDPEAASVDRS